MMVYGTGIYQYQVPYIPGIIVCNYHAYNYILRIIIYYYVTYNYRALQQYTYQVPWLYPSWRCFGQLVG